MTTDGNINGSRGLSPISRRKRIAVIGGGVSGAVAAQQLTELGHSVLVLDKGRGAGGRCSTRHNEIMEVDHGAQYFTVSNHRFGQAVDIWSRHGVIERWDGRFVEIEAGLVTQALERDRWVGVPGMSRIVSHLLHEAKVLYAARVNTLKKHSDGWWIRTDTGTTHGPFDDLIVAMPPAQTCELLAGTSSLLVDAAKSVVMTPCWSAMVAIDGTTGIVFDAAKLRGHESLEWVARNSSKPGRSCGLPETWVLHADREWSGKHLEISRDDAGQALVGAFQRLCELQNVKTPKVLQTRAHRWRFARTGSPLGVACLTDHERSITICGDWLLGAKIEAAYLSGLATAERLHQNLT